MSVPYQIPCSCQLTSTPTTWSSTVVLLLLRPADRPRPARNPQHAPPYTTAGSLATVLIGRAWVHPRDGVHMYVQRVWYVPTVPMYCTVHRPVSLHRCQTRGQATITPSIATPQSRHGRNALRLPASGTIHRGQIPCHYRQLLRAVP
jgi:hypothetical protein